MIRLCYSNRTEVLLERLAENISAQRARDGVWTAVQVVVPNAQVEAYLRQALARRLGIAANLRFRFLDGLYRFSLPSPLRLLDRGVLQGALLACFQDPDVLNQDHLSSVRAYLQGDTSGLRAVQLSGELARLFEEYALSRPQWIKAWNQSREAVTGGPPELEAWQRQLWWGCRERLATGPAQWILLPEYLDPDQGYVERTEFPAAIHVFGVSHVAQTYHQVFHRVGSVTELLLYTLNPCEEFWDDLETDREVRLRRARESSRMLDAASDDPFGLMLAQDTRALQLWARPGREYIRLLNGLAEYDFESYFPELPGDTLLQRLQEEIRQRQGAPAEPDARADGSLRILACPGARREAEAVADQIWDAVEGARRKGEVLRFSDIAIIVPAARRAACAAHLKAAFEAAHRIPLTELEAPRASLESVLEAASLLLQLPRSDLNRRSVLEALSHPALLEAHPELDPEPWAGWCDSVGIVRGANAADLDGTYLERDTVSWDQGLGRLALGAFLPGDVPLELEDHRLWPGPDAEALSAFLSLARRLVTDVQALRALRTDARTWAERLSGYLANHLSSPEESRTRALQKIQKALSRLEELAPEGMTPAELDCAGALELARTALERAAAESSGNMAQGVVLSSYLPMRAIPFKVLILMGLGEGLFPTQDPPNPLDLRAFQRLPGDVSPSERDRYLFLEMLLCARERLILSYVARDPISGEALEPSAPLRELKEIAQVHLESSDHGKLVVPVPLHRREDAGCRIPAARLEAQAAIWGVERRVLAGIQSLDETALAPVLESLPLPAVAQRERLSIRLPQLRKWLECPLQGAARLRLGMNALEEREGADVEDEPFEAPRLARREILRGSLWDALEGEDLESAYRRRRERMEARSGVSLGLLGDQETRSDLEVLNVWRGFLDGAVLVHRFGDAGEADPAPSFLHRSLTVDVETPEGPVSVEISGRTEPLWRGGSLLLSERRGDKDTWDGVRFTAREQREALKAYLDQVILAAAGLFAEPHRAWICAAGDPKHQGLGALVFPALDQETALGMLREWLREILSEPHPWAIPIEAVLEDAEDLGAWMEQKLASDLGFSSRYGPVPRPEDHLPPADFDWKGLVQKRLGGFLSAIKTGGAS